MTFDPVGFILISSSEISEDRTMEKLIKLLTDPVSNQIIQLIRVREKMTIADILAATPSVPRATVYRKIDRMLSAGVIEVSDSHKVRGQTEKVYSIKKNYISSEDGKSDGLKIMTTTLLQIFELCRQYFQRSDADVNRDKLFVLNYAIPLSDGDFSLMLQEMYGVIDKYQKKEPSADSQLRNLYLMSMPSGGNENE